MAYEWVDVDRAFLARRYDRLAGLIPFFEWLFFLPRGLRFQAVESLKLHRGARVLEVGCGTGRNFRYLQEVVGPTGRIYGVDVSAGMLHKSRDLCRRKGWSNIELIECDAADYESPESLDAVFFSLSYNTMPHHQTVLRQAWKQLHPGGRLVVMDAKLPPGLGGRLVLPFSLWLMRRTMLGNPFIEPWKDLARLPGHFDMDEFLLGSYYICRIIKA